MGKNEKQRAKTRENLMDAFWEIYKSKRIEQIRVKEITTRAGYHRATFYEYFADVYQLFDELEASIIPSSEDVILFLKSPLQQFTSLYEKHNHYYMVLLGENGDPTFMERVQKQLKLSIFPLLQDKFSDKEKLHTALEYTLSAIASVLTHWYNTEQALPQEQLVAILHELSTNGVGNILLKTAQA